MAKTTFNPDNPAFATPDGSTIFEKFEYSAAVRTGNLVFVAGQIGLNPDGTVPDDDEGQIIRAFERLQLILETAGCGMEDLVELVSYHVGLKNHLAQFVEIKKRFVPKPFPTWSIIEIAGLARPGLVIEIKAVAAVPGP